MHVPVRRTMAYHANHSWTNRIGWFFVGIAGVVMVLLLPSSTLRAKTLEWKLQPDQRLRLSVERTVRQKSQAAEWTETIRYQVLWVVHQRDSDNRIHLVQTLTDVKHSLQFPGVQPVVYDSTADAEPRGDAAELARYWKPLLQVERPVVLMTNGQVVPGGPAGSVAPTDTKTAPPGTNATVSRPDAARLVAEANWVLPADDVSVGDSWADVRMVPWRDIADALKVTTSYTYQGEEEVEQRRFDKIVVQARWDIQPMPADPRRLTLDRQVGTGVIYFDDQAGYLSRSEFSQDLAIRVDRAGVDPVHAEVSTVLKIRCQPVIPVPETAEVVTPSPE